MATIKSFTSLEQSKKLAEILPLESADMFIADVINSKEQIHSYAFHILTTWGCITFAEIKERESNHIKFIPCWTLSALLEQLPYEICDDDGNSSYLQINKEDDLYQLVYEDPYRNFESIETDRYEYFVDACYEMVLKLKENNLL